jgi:hypothetical protein
MGRFHWLPKTPINHFAGIFFAILQMTHVSTPSQSTKLVTVTVLHTIREQMASITVLSVLDTGVLSSVD